MKKDIIYFKDLDTFYQMTDVDDSFIQAVKIRRDTKTRADFLIWQLGGGVERHYILMKSSLKNPYPVKFRGKKKNHTHTTFISSIKFVKKQVKIEYILLTGSTFPTNYASIAMPLMRRIFPQTISKDLVSVIPMSDPPKIKHAYTTSINNESVKSYCVKKYTGGKL